MLRYISWLIIAVLILPIAGGMILIIPPAFGYLPLLGGDAISLEPWQRLWHTPGISRSIGVSFATGLATTALALIVVFAFLATFSPTRFDRWVNRLMSPLLSVPHAAAAFGFAFLIAPSGLLLRGFSPWLTGFERPPDIMVVNDPFGLSLIAGLAIKEIPFLLLVSLAALPQLNAQQKVMLARSLGYHPRIAWLKVVAPGLYQLVRLPVYAVLAFATSTVDVAMILGPNLPSTLSVQVVQWFNDPDLSYRFLAAAGALLQLLVTGMTLVTWWALEITVARLFLAWIRRGGRRGGDRLIRVTGRSGMVMAISLSGLGLLALFVNSVAGFWRFPSSWPANFTLSHWLAALPTIERPLVTTLVVAGLAASIAMLLVLAALEQEQRQNKPATRALCLLYLPLLIPQVGFLSGITVLSEMAGYGPSLLVVVWGHLLFVLPYIYLTLSESYRQLDPRWAWIARSLGSSQAGIFWRIRVPLLLRPMLMAFALGVAISASQYLPTQLLGGGRIVTITTEAVALSSGGDRRLIGVWGLVQAMVPLLGFLFAMLIPKLLWRRRKGMQGA